MGATYPSGPGLLVSEASWSHLLGTLQSVVLLYTSDPPVAETSTLQHTTTTRDIHAPGGIWNRNYSKRSAANPRLRPHGHWDRLMLHYVLHFKHWKKGVRRGVTFAAVKEHYNICKYISLPWHNSPSVGQGLLTVEDSRSHSDTPQSVGLRWTSDQPDAETFTWEQATLTGNKHSCPRRNSNL